MCFDWPFLLADWLCWLVLFTFGSVGLFGVGFGWFCLNGWLAGGMPAGVWMKYFDWVIAWLFVDWSVGMVGLVWFGWFGGLWV